MTLRLIQDGDTAAAADINQYYTAFADLDAELNIVTLFADGATDQSVVLQAALDALGYGETLYVKPSNPSSAVAIANPIIVPLMGIRIVGLTSGVGNQGLRFVATANLNGGRGSMFTWLPTSYTNINEGCGAENFNVDMNGYTGHGITVCRGYNNSSFRNIRVVDVADDYSAWRFIKHLDHPGIGVTTGSQVSQSITCENIHGVHKNNTATVATIYMEYVQESIFLGCKAWAGSGSISACAAPAWEIKDCRGVQFYGPSAVCSNSAGFLVEAVNRTCESILIDAPTFELIGGDSVAMTASTDLVSFGATATTMGIVAGQVVRFGSLTGAAPLAEDTTYYVRAVSGTTFKVATTNSDATIVNITTDGSAIMYYGAPPAGIPFGDTKLVHVLGNASYDVAQVVVRSPRYQFPVYGRYQMTYASSCDINAAIMSAVVDATGTFCHVTTMRSAWTQVPGASSNTLIGLPEYVAGVAYMTRFDPSISTTKLFLGLAPSDPSFVAVAISTGAGTPEGSVTAPPGSLYLNQSGGAGTTLYVKQTGTGNTGWAAK